MDGTVTGWGAITIPLGLSNVVAITAGGPFWLALKSDGTVTGSCYNITNGVVTLSDGVLSNVVAVATGNYRCLALRRDGTIVGWGRNQYGETTGVASGDLAFTNATVTLGGRTLTNVVAVAAGDSHSLALSADGKVVAWGDNSYGQTNVPVTLSNAVSIAVGGSEPTRHCLALRTDGKAVAWGSNSYSQTNIPPGLSNVAAVAVGSTHCLAVIGGAPPMAHARISRLRWTTNGFFLSMPSENGRVYSLEYCDSLGSPNWQPLPLVAGSGSEVTLSDPNPAPEERFYRVRRW
jgi:alpha-tubulin suppressor-like RCC1 family protein